ncbi:nucleotide sugar dehydrogenase [Flavobacteriaceae bacterium]|nr:nucleotide sugar dehydrogenase [Flavobacteriaceae bacterium]
MENKIKISIIGLGYVGLPLAVLFSKKYCVTGYDIDLKRISDLNNGLDITNEIDSQKLSEVIVDNSKSKGLFITSDINELINSDYFIITVPTPIDKNNKPDLTPLIKASELVGKYIKKNSVVVYESTVYPGATQEDCVPILENSSSLVFNKDFFVGYSPERINPGDKEHTVDKIVKVTSGSTPEVAKKIDDLYKSVITAGTYKATSIMVAEMAKVIENTQRDINIAFVNELSKITSKLGINTSDVLEAAGTKWNFLQFKPGLVGGHCIGVDPYYLAQKAEQLGYFPEIILAGRRLNNSMGDFVGSECIKLMIQKDIKIKSAKALILGFTFKENCPDIRNTGVIKVRESLISFGLSVDVFDPNAENKDVMTNYGFDLLEKINTKYDLIVLAVDHHNFKTIEINNLKKSLSVIYDIKSTLNNSDRAL